MPVNLSIKEVPDALADKLRRRAARNHRSLQRELMVIVEAAVAEPAATPAALAAESTAAYEPVQRDAEAGDDGLLAELDAVVAGSRWGSAPLLTREQANDRRLQRELEFDSRRAADAAP